MEKGKRIEAEFLLPEAITQHIQSFFSGKEAAQTSILSKSWYGAWLTRPNLDFDQRDFRRNGGDRDPKSRTWDRFPEFAKKTIQRYEELNLKIESFRLCVESTETDIYLLANELIVKAVKMGATDLNLEFLSRTATFALPYEVLGSENVVRLSVNGCNIELGADGKVSCSRLKSLSLRSVYIEGDIIWDIMSSCPLIEELSLFDCACFYEDHSYSFVTTRTKMLELSPFVEFGRQNVESFVDGPINPYEFRNLTCLFMKYVKIDTLFFRDFSSKFPCLKDLTLDQCLGSKQIQISSHSLECIRVSQIRMLRAKFDVPSIRKFRLSSSHLPSLSFATPSGEWESEISVSPSSISTLWFRKLKKLLTKMSLSRISLSFYLYLSSIRKDFDYGGDNQCLPKPIVENLTMSTASSYPSDFWDGLFWSCRPKFITTYWSTNSYKGPKVNDDFLEVLRRRLTQEVRENCFTANRNMFCQHDLEEANVKLFEETVAEWRPLPWKTLLDASACPDTRPKIRFQLRWGQ